MNAPIQNAKNVLLNQNSGTLPNMLDAITGYFQPMVFTTIVQSTPDFQVFETPTEVNFMGVWQPLSAQKVAMKEEGQRNWKWYQVHSDIGLQLAPSDVITYLGEQYRVMEKLNYSIYGYMEYHLVDDYTGSGPG